jgi:SAM-dependent methyltransferase
MDRQTLAAYAAGAAAYAQDWHGQPAPADLHVTVARYFHRGLTADIGCGSGREVAWRAANGYDAVGYDCSDALLEQARMRYRKLRFEAACLPHLDAVPDSAFDNVLCETVIMHMPRDQIAPSVERLIEILRPGGILYLSWRVTEGADQRDVGGRLYTAFDRALVRGALGTATPLLDEETVSASSGKRIHRIVARKAAA